MCKEGRLCSLIVEMVIRRVCNSLSALEYRPHWSVLLDCCCKIFWTVMAKDYMALIDPTGNPVPIVRQGTPLSDWCLDCFCSGNEIL